MKRKQPIKGKKLGSVHKEPAAPGTPAYQPTQVEQVKLWKHHARVADDTAPRLKVLAAADFVATIVPEHPDFNVGYALLMEALGTTDGAFVDGLIKLMATATANENGRANEADLNFMAAVVKGIKPTDQLEAMLAAQMAVINTATMMNAGLLYRLGSPQEGDMVANSMNKCARTFAMLMDTLKRYRTSGQQTMTVQHVSVSEGGQAILGNVTHAPRKTSTEKPVNSTPAVTDARQPAMPIVEGQKRSRNPIRRRQNNDERSPA
jgi:hypothetical protein